MPFPGMCNMALLKFIAVDLGAESGRTMLGFLDKDSMRLEEMHRFPNPQVKLFGRLYWDVLYLFNELKKGLALTARQGHRDLAGIGVDTWGVDFGLVGRDNQLLGFPYAYRDSGSEGMMEKAFERVPREEIYNITGIQFMQFNSLFRLLSMAESEHPLLHAAEKLLFMPDLVNFLLTGEKVSEYTIASTSQMLTARTGQWAADLLEKIGLPGHILPPIIQPGTAVGSLLPDITREAGISPVEVIAPACHDTASAVAAVPAAGKNWAYLSSGTWSLIGVENDSPIINRESLDNNFTNEGGVNGSIRFLRNAMGLWLLQGCRRKWQSEGANLDYAELVGLAENAPACKCFVDPDDSSFLNPPDMPAAIADFCRRSGQNVPASRGEFVRCVLESLAFKYRFLIDKINAMRSQPVEILHIVGGGSRNGLLNRFTANAAGIPVTAGPAEATAIGNVLVQALARRELDSIAAGRQLVAASFPLQTYEPENQSRWQDTYNNIKHLFS